MGKTRPLVTGLFAVYKKPTTQISKMSGDTPKSYNKFRVYQPYDAAYNARVHGPFIPWREYGKPRMSIWDMKIGSMWSHFLNSDKSPAHMRMVASKAVWRYCGQKLARKTSFKPFMALVFSASCLPFLARYGDYAAERRVKYHW